MRNNRTIAAKIETKRGTTKVEPSRAEFDRHRTSANHGNNGRTRNAAECEFSCMRMSEDPYASRP